MKYLLLAVLISVLVACSKPDATDKVTPDVAVTVAPAKCRDIPIRTNGPATIYPKQQANVTSRITARITELKAGKGDRVRAGETLAVLENQDLIAKVEESKGAVENAAAALQKTQVSTLPADLARAQSQMDSAQATLDQAQKDLKRRKRLFARGAISSKLLLQSQTAYTTAQANLASAKKSFEVISKHSKVDVRIAQSQLDQAKAQLAAANAALSFSEIHAPFSGTITQQFLYPGDMVTPSAPIFTVMDTSEFIARAQIPEADALAIHMQDPCTFSSGEDAEMNRATWQGQVTVISAAVDLARRTVETWCEIKPPFDGMKAGLFGAVEVQTGTIHNAVTVPASAVNLQEGTDHGSVVIVDANDIAHTRNVTVGQRFGNDLYIKSGLNPKDTVITVGNYDLPDGTHVRPERQQSGK